MGNLTNNETLKGYCEKTFCPPAQKKIKSLKAEIKILKAEIFALRDDLKAEQETACRQRIEIKMLKKQLPTKIKIRRWFK